MLRTGPTALEFSLWLQTLDTGIRLPIRVLINSGATGTFISQDFVKSFHLTTNRLEAPIPVQNADRTVSRGGPIQSTCDVFILAPPSYQERFTLEVTSISTYDVILGFLWLHQHNPRVDWKEGTIDLFRDTSPSLSTGDEMLKKLEDDRTDVLEELISSLGLPSVPKPFDFL